MSLLRAQVVFQPRNGVPADIVTNTFHIMTSAEVDTEAEAEPFAEAVRDFYTVVGPNQNVALMTLMAPTLATVGHQVRVYRVDPDTNTTLPFPGAPPLWVEAFDLLGLNAGLPSLPSEVSLVLSLRNVSAVNVPAARRRGRIYFGPVIQAKNTTVLGQGRPDEDIMGELVRAGQNLQNRVQALPGVDGLVVYSRPYEGRGAIVRPGRPTLPPIAARGGSTFLVEQFIVDNAWDTQRRRGPKATSRVIVLDN